MRVVLATFGTAGDVLPFIHVGRALRRRGHSVEVVTDVAHRPLVEREALEARTSIARYDPVALTQNPVYANPTFGPYRLWTDIFVPLVPELFASVSEALKTPTSVVIIHPWCFGALYAAQAAKVPAASISMAPLSWWSIDDPGLYSPGRPPRFLHKAILRWPVRWTMNGLFGSGLNRARVALGLPKARRPFFALNQECEVSYGLWSPTMRGPAADDPRNATFCGFVQNTGEAALSPELEQFLAAGAPPLVVGVGSLLPPMATRLYELAQVVARRLGLRAVLVGANPSLAAADTFVAAHVPYAALFPRAKVLVHHGGAGTLSESLRSGRPQAVVPFGNDQYDNAWRLERLGLGRSVPKVKLTEARLLEVVTHALGAEVERRAAEVRAQVLAERDGTEVLVDDLERRFGAQTRS